VQSNGLVWDLEVGTQQNLSLEFTSSFCKRLFNQLA
jgi:hypothetical protein